MLHFRNRLSVINSSSLLHAGKNTNLFLNYARCFEECGKRDMLLYEQEGRVHKGRDRKRRQIDMESRILRTPRERNAR